MKKGWCTEERRGREEVPKGREAVSPWETSNTLHPCDQPAPWFSGDSFLPALLKPPHIDTDTHTHTLDCHHQSFHITSPVM